MIKILIFLFQVIIFYLFSSTITNADFQKNLIEKLISTKTLSFDFKQKIAEKVEVGNCFIKYPLLMKCNYKNSKQKILISNGKTVAIIKKKIQKNLLLSLKINSIIYYSSKRKNYKLN